MRDTAIAANWLDRAPESGPDSRPDSRPDSPSALPQHSGTASLTASCLETMGELIDDAVEADREVARAIARLAAVIDQARAWSEATAPLMPPDPFIVRRWRTQAVARRSLVSELAAALRLAERTAENLVEESRSLLHELPGTMAPSATATSATVTRRRSSTMPTRCRWRPADHVKRRHSRSPRNSALAGSTARLACCARGRIPSPSNCGTGPLATHASCRSSPASMACPGSPPICRRQPPKRSTTG